MDSVSLGRVSWRHQSGGFTPLLERDKTQSEERTSESRHDGTGSGGRVTEYFKSLYHENQNGIRENLQGHSKPVPFVFGFVVYCTTGTLVGH